jgi:hypothetical protein
MASRRIELWLKENGGIEEITDHEAFSAKIKKSNGNAFNVAIIGPKRSFLYRTSWNVMRDNFQYTAMNASNVQIQKAISLGLILLDIKG